MDDKKKGSNFGALTVGLLLLLFGCYLVSQDTIILAIIVLLAGAGIVVWLLWTGQIKFLG